MSYYIMAHPSPAHDQSLPPEALGLCRQIARRVNRGVFLTRAAAPVGSAIIIFGLAYLFAQMLAPRFTPYTYWFLSLVPLALLWAWRDCRRHGRFFDHADAVELADKLTRADGLATTAWERPTIATDTGLWAELSRRLDSRPLRLAPSFFAWRLVPAFAFAGIVFFVPPRKPDATPAFHVMEGFTQPLQEKMKMSAELLPEAEREKLQEQIEQLQTADSSVTREKWEAVEDVQQKLEDALTQSNAAAQQLSDSLAEMSNLAANMANATSAQKAAAMQNQMEDMADMLENLMKNGAAPLDKKLQEDLRKALAQCKGGNCSAADLDKLRERANALADKVSKQLGKTPSGRPGSGAVERGRADAALDFGVERNLENATFDPQQVQNQYSDNNHLTDLGVTIIEPNPNPGVFKPATVKQFASPEGSNVSRTEISPAQRGVVSRYFN